MSLEELQDLVGAFRKTLAELSRSGCQAASAEACAPSIDLGSPESSASPLAAIDSAAELMSSRESLAQIRDELGDCHRCGLSEGRQTIVFGCGNEGAPLMFVGEAPGAEEDRLGEPFVGPAGQLLDKMIVAMGWQRESVYISNVLKCRPPNNRNPKSEEIAACEGFLARQIQSVAPRVIVTLGKPAAHLLLHTSESMGKLRGLWQEYRGIPVMPTYHPAYLLREPGKKRETWADLQQVMQRLEEMGLTPG